MNGLNVLVITMVYASDCLYFQESSLRFSYDLFLDIIEYWNKNYYK